MNILVTGSAGFIARTLIKRLITEGHFVYGLDIIETTGFDSRSFRSLIFDITDPRVCNPDYGAMEIFQKVDAVFHLAAMANVDEVAIKREKCFQVNVHGTYNIIEACRKLDIPLLFASTACTYGWTKQHPSTEDGPTVPVDWYGVSKRADEEIIKGLLKKYVIMRFGTTFGGDMREALCTHIFLKQAIEKKPFTIKGDGLQTRNFIYIDDLVDGQLKCLKWIMNGGSSEVFNLVGENTYTILCLAKICDRIVNPQDPTTLNTSKIRVEYLPARPDDVYQEDISIEKAKRLLKWTPMISLEQGMKQIYEQWKNKDQ